MINRLYFKNNLSFDECELEFSEGLNVLSGPSGAGKSVIMKSILSAFGLSEASAAILSLESSLKLADDSLEHEAVNIYALKKDKSTRHFYNHQSLSKKFLSEHLSKQIVYLGAKNADELQPANLLKVIDEIAQASVGFKDLLEQYHNLYEHINSLQAELASLEKDESELEELRDFLEFEINKIKQANIKIGEYDELLSIKSKLSKSDKLKRVLEEASGVFAYTHKVKEALRLLEIDDEAFSDVMSEIEDHFAQAINYENEYDIEVVLNRLEEINKVLKKYHSEEQALEVLKQNEQKLSSLEDVEFNKSALQKQIAKEQKQALELAKKISKIRCEASVALQEKINEYLKSLYLKNLNLVNSQTILKQNGIDEFHIRLETADFKDISSGELNRLRLAFLAGVSAFSSTKGVMFLDEIDANLSGKEAISIAKLISDLAKNYQIFVITHLPWLCARANRHILVEKTKQKSSARVLKPSEIQAELARMISDEDTSKSAMEFAKALLEQRNS